MGGVSLMARSGPLPKPTELKALEGNRGHRALNLDATFRPEVGMPSVPKDLAPEARKVWRRLGEELLRYNLMSVVYSDTFEDLCETIATVKMLRRSIRGAQQLAIEQQRDPAEAFECRSPGGMPVQHPRYQTFRAERAHMHTVLAKFGLTPAEQARVTTAVRAQLKLFEGGAGGDDKPPTGGAVPGGLPGSFAEF